MLVLVVTPSAGLNATATAFTTAAVYTNCTGCRNECPRVYLCVRVGRGADCIRPPRKKMDPDKITFIIFFLSHFTVKTKNFEPQILKRFFSGSGLACIIVWGGGGARLPMRHITTDLCRFSHLVRIALTEVFKVRRRQADR